MGDILEEQGEIVEEPTSLIGQPFYFKVNIVSANLIESNWKKIYIHYSLKNQEGIKEVHISLTKGIQNFLCLRICHES
jgi:hypothetical protein